MGFHTGLVLTKQGLQGSMLESYLFLHVYLKAIDSHTHFHDFTDNLQFWLPLLRAYYVPNTLFVIYLT